MARLNNDFYVCNDCSKTFPDTKIYNPTRNFYICLYCLPKKLVSTVMKTKFA